MTTVFYQKQAAWLWWLFKTNRENCLENKVKRESFKSHQIHATCFRVKTVEEKKTIDNSFYFSWCCLQKASLKQKRYNFRVAVLQKKIMLDFYEADISNPLNLLSCLPTFFGISSDEVKKYVKVCKSLKVWDNKREWGKYMRKSLETSKNPLIHLKEFHHHY